MAKRTYSEEELAFLSGKEASELERRRGVGEESGGPYVRSRRPGGKPKMTVIYSVRLSDEWVERLREVATREGEAPSSLLRRWAEERLEQAEKGDVGADVRVRRAVRLELERAGLVKRAS